MNIWLIYIWEQHLLVQKKNLKQTCDLRTVSLLHVWSLKCRALLHLEETCAVPSFRFIVSETWILLNFCSPFTSMFLEVRIECRRRSCVIHHPEMSYLPCKSWGKKKKKATFSPCWICEWEEVEPIEEAAIMKICGEHSAPFLTHLMHVYLNFGYVGNNLLLHVKNQFFLIFS